ncbi:periplasmic binding protein-like II [Gonapodya prolifera JEL478]|uniref:Periplasmic binding protein-like II n=1 Tax=Gonapodya prolifera (strain JEL478) TaxID=1344416 RepID=A0A139A674_GONPJ|nr:periplasmic binding protein-like II [Gonapodya prolifera JEL478]|eukprot:KXS12234.1 periplasmic binding protein-like II [Gonapodya prolifera JEL478]
MVAGLVNAGQLTFGFGGFDLPPAHWITPDGTHHGYDAEVATELGKRLGVNVVWVQKDWDKFRSSCDNGEVDAIFVGQAITDKRKTYIDFSVPYGEFDECLLVKADSPIKNDAEALRGMRIGAITDSTNMTLGENWDRQLGGTGKGSVVKLVGFDGATDDVLGDMVKAMDKGETDGVIDDEIAFPKYIDTGKYRAVLSTHTRQIWALAFSKSRGASVQPGPVDVRTACDKVLTGMIEDGTMATLWKKWFGEGNQSWASAFGAKPVPEWFKVDKKRANRKGLVTPGTITYGCFGAPVVPINYFDEDGNRVGYESAVGEEIARRLGVKARWIQKDWDKFRDAVDNREVDCILIGQAITEYRLGFFDFSKPYGCFDECLLVHIDSTISKVEDLRGKTIGAISNSTNIALGERWDKELGGTGKGSVVTLRGFDGATADVLGDMVAAMDAGETQGVIDDEIAFPKYIDTGKYKAVLSTATQHRWALAFSKAQRAVNSTVLAAVNSAMSDMISDGTFEALWSKWFGPENKAWVSQFGAKPPASIIAKP